LHHGSMRVVRVTEQVLVFERDIAGERLRCTFNLSDAAANCDDDRLPAIVTVGDVSSGRLGPWAAVIEKLV